MTPAKPPAVHASRPLPPPVYRPAAASQATQVMPGKTMQAKRATAVPASRPLPPSPPAYRPGASAQPVQAKAAVPARQRGNAAAVRQTHVNLAAAAPRPLQRQSTPVPNPARASGARPVIQRAESAPLLVSERLSITGLTVTATDQGLALSGSLSNGTAITGSVYTPAYYLDAGGKAQIEPITEHSASIFQKARWQKAMRVQNISVEPKGQALGDYLAWYVADKAGKAGISYIVAMHVVPKARNFYERLGFQEYNQAFPYSMLVKAKEKLDARMRIVADTDPSALPALGEEQARLIDAMSDATLLVPVATLLTRARANWESKWRRVRQGEYERK